MTGGGDPDMPVHPRRCLPSADATRRAFGGGLIGSALVGLDPARAADDFPGGSVLRIVVPFAAGGGTDLVARAVADAIANAWHASLIIDNKPGAGTTLGAVAVAHAPPDGTTLLANTASFLISPRIMGRAPYDPEHDFTPVALLASSPHVLVIRPGIPATSVEAFAEWAKAQPTPPTFASFGVGSSSHLGFELLAARLGIRAVHVPYRGAAPALVDLLGGRVDAMLADLSAVSEHVTSGGLRALAITGPARVASLPAVPDASEAGIPGFQSESWFGLMARAGTPEPIVRRWNEAAVAALGAAPVRTKLAAIGIEARGSTPEAFGSFLRAEAAKYADAIARSGARME